eukprot:TRINITY_DN24186_c0_g1_i2.p1 TRINITY_DN24186_c0_g1~~TRINITY_DN24186_c0_g1_i2.p1  ORF type:complete len:291 (+),score=63.46 TRINITY_DN24186_c0_g1_i2:11-883(+)
MADDASNPFSADVNPFSGDISEEESAEKQGTSYCSSGYAGNGAGKSTQAAGSFDTVDDTAGPRPSAIRNSGAESSSFPQDLDNCSICGAQLGKRRLNPRHHCRICGRCVCGACSPSSVQMQGAEGLQRVCTPCVNIPEFRHRIVQLGDVLRGVSLVELPLEETKAPDNTLIRAVELAEAAVPPVCSALRRERQKAAELEAALHQSQAREQAARAACLQMCQRLASLAGTTRSVSEQTSELGDVTDQCLSMLDLVEQRVALPGRLEEALGLCDAALAPLREAQKYLRPQAQ